MTRYDKCKKCGAEAVHLATSDLLLFYGEGFDHQGKKSEYDDEIIETDVIICAHICFKCGEIADVFIESPREKAITLPIAGETVRQTSTGGETPSGEGC